MNTFFLFLGIKRIDVYITLRLRLGLLFAFNHVHAYSHCYCIAFIFNKQSIFFLLPKSPMPLVSASPNSL